MSARRLAAGYSAYATPKDIDMNQQGGIGAVGTTVTWTPFTWTTPSWSHSWITV